jgi:hypothetical protein
VSNIIEGKTEQVLKGRSRNEYKERMKRRAREKATRESEGVSVCWRKMKGSSQPILRSNANDEEAGERAIGERINAGEEKRYPRKWDNGKTNYLVEASVPGPHSKWIGFG